MIDVEAPEASAEMSKEDLKSHLLFQTVALLLGYNELAKQTDILGEKAYFRLIRGQYEEMLKESGQTIEIIHDKVILTLGQRPLHVNSLEKDIELMRQTVAEFDLMKVVHGNKVPE
jgi:hypothetical protein